MRWGEAGAGDFGANQTAGPPRIPTFRRFLLPTAFRFLFLSLSHPFLFFSRFPTLPIAPPHTSPSPPQPTLPSDLPIFASQASYFPTPPDEVLPMLNTLSSFTVRDLPYSFDFLVENLMDPAHIPFAHHSLQVLATPCRERVRGRLGWRTHESRGREMRGRDGGDGGEVGRVGDWDGARSARRDRGSLRGERTHVRSRAGEIGNVGLLDHELRGKRPGETRREGRHAEASRARELRDYWVDTVQRHCR
jgi:phenylpropionate dioxygenase-like ring-hydroxylating dioxygenase large terminal subunit